MGMMPENRTRKWDEIIRKHALSQLPDTEIIEKQKTEKIQAVENKMRKIGKMLKKD